MRAIWTAAGLVSLVACASAPTEADVFRHFYTPRGFEDPSKALPAALSRTKDEWEKDAARLRYPSSWKKAPATHPDLKSLLNGDQDDAHASVGFPDKQGNREQGTGSSRPEM